MTTLDELVVAGLERGLREPDLRRCFSAIGKARAPARRFFGFLWTSN
jgi:hypothetical protein